MFTITITGNQNAKRDWEKYAAPLEVQIEGCPSGGLAAVDFRRQHGLPDGASDRVYVPPFRFVDEATARRLPVDGSADYDAADAMTIQWACNSAGEVYRANSWERRRLATPSQITAYLAEQTPHTALNLILDMLGAEQRSKTEAEQQAREYAEEKAGKAKAVEDARALLRDELASLRGDLKEAESWKGKYWERLKIVSEALAYVPEDAIRGALKTLAQERAETVAQLAERVSEASTHTLFEEES